MEPEMRIVKWVLLIPPDLEKLTKLDILPPALVGGVFVKYSSFFFSCLALVPFTMRSVSQWY